MTTAAPKKLVLSFSAPPFCDSVIQDRVFFTEPESKQLMKFRKVVIGNTGFIDYICRLLCDVEKDIILGFANAHRDVLGYFLCGSKLIGG